MVIRSLRVFVLAVALSLLAIGVSAQPIPFPGGTPVHALTLSIDANGSLSVADYMPTALRGSLESQPIAQYVEALQAAQDAEYDIATVQLMDNASGAVVYQTTVTVARWIRGEFAIDPNNLNVKGEHGSNIAGYRIPWQERTFAVSVPMIPGATRLEVALTGMTRSSTLIDLADVAGQFGLRGLRDVSFIPLDGYTLASPANRMDIVILGDGYTAAQQAQFEADAKAMADSLFSFPPYSEYRNYFNVVAVFGASNESGTDEPPYMLGCAPDNTHPISCCPDGDPSLSGVMVDTRYNTTFCYGGIARLMVPTNYDAIYADATEGYPDWDEIFVLANTFTYGGSGGAIAAISKNILAAEMLQHEVGHSIIGLDDEYDTYTPGYPPCSDTGRAGINTPCRANVTDRTARSLIKWARWISPSTPVPTSAALPADVAGSWLGAHYSPTIYYRPCFDCTMRNLGRPFGPVQSEQLAVSLYSGGWEGTNSFMGTPGTGTGVDIVEPGTLSPDPLAGTVTIPFGASQTFSLDVLSPGDDANTRVRWRVNDALMHEMTYEHGETATFTFTPITAGTYTVSAEVTDVGGILHPTQTNISRTTVTWAIAAEGGAAGGTELLVNSSFETAKAANPKQPDGWKTAKAGSSKLKCNNGTMFAHDGSCAYMLKGTAGTTSIIKQVVPAVGGPGDAFSISGWFDTMNLKVDAFVRVKFVMSNGSAVKLDLGGLPRDKDKIEPYLYLENSHFFGIDAPTVTKIVVQVKIIGAGGKVYVDALSLRHYDDLLLPPPVGRLPLPDAFRAQH